MPAIDPVTAVSNVVSDVIERVVPDPVAQANAKASLAAIVTNGTIARLNAAAGVVVAEANSQFGLTAQWRPILMLSFTAIIVNNYILAPYLSAMFGFHVVLDIPPQMWDLLKIGVGGYIVGRSGEKIAQTYAKAKQPAPTVPAISFNTNGG